MSDITGGLTWTVEYDGMKEATSCFAKLEMKQEMNHRTTASHIFMVADQAAAERIYKEFMGKDEIKFKIQTQNGQTGFYYHAPLAGVNHLTFSGGSNDNQPIIEIHTTDVSVDKMFRHSRRMAIQTSGNVSDAIRTVCQKTGIEYEAKNLTIAAVEEFKALYQPGCSDWDFITRYLLPRLPIAGALVWQDGKKLQLFDRSKPNDDVLEFPAVFTKNHRKADLKLETYVAGGGDYLAYWVSPVGNVEKMGDGVEPKARQHHVQKFLTTAAVKAVTKGRNLRKGNNAITVVESHGAIRDGKYIAPGATFKGDGFDTNGFLTAARHQITGGRYDLSLTVQGF